MLQGVNLILFDRNDKNTIFLFQVPACPKINQVFIYVFLFLNFVILLITRLGISGRKQDLVMPYLSYAITLAQVLGVLYSKRSRLGPTDLLGWVLLFDYLIYVTLPLRLRYCVLLSMVTCISYTVAQVWLKENYFNVVLLVSIYYYFTVFLLNLCLDIYATNFMEIKMVKWFIRINFNEANFKQR